MITAAEQNAKAFDWIKEQLAAKRCVYLSRQFYSGCKHIRIVPRRLKDIDTFLRINSAGKLQVREGRQFFDVLGHYRIVSQHEGHK